MIHKFYEFYLFDDVPLVFRAKGFSTEVTITPCSYYGLFPDGYKLYDRWIREWEYLDCVVIICRWNTGKWNIGGCPGEGIEILN